MASSTILARWAGTAHIAPLVFPCRIETARAVFAEANAGFPGFEAVLSFSGTAPELANDLRFGGEMFFPTLEEYAIDGHGPFLDRPILTARNEAASRYKTLKSIDEGKEVRRQRYQIDEKLRGTKEGRESIVLTRGRAVEELRVAMIEYRKSQDLIRAWFRHPGMPKLDLAHVFEHHFRAGTGEVSIAKPLTLSLKDGWTGGWD